MLLLKSRKFLLKILVSQEFVVLYNNRDHKLPTCQDVVNINSAEKGSTIHGTGASREPVNERVPLPAPRGKYRHENIQLFGLKLKCHR